MLKGRAYHCNDVTVKWGHVHFIQQTVQSPVKTFCLGFPSGPVVKSLPANTGDMGLILSLGRFHMLQGNRAHSPQLLKSVCPRTHALQQEKPPQ